jgi:hypothetical protein
MMGMMMQAFQRENGRRRTAYFPFLLALKNIKMKTEKKENHQSTPEEIFLFKMTTDEALQWIYVADKQMLCIDAKNKLQRIVIER